MRKEWRSWPHAPYLLAGKAWIWDNIMIPGWQFLVTWSKCKSIIWTWPQDFKETTDHCEGKSFPHWISLKGGITIKMLGDYTTIALGIQQKGWIQQRCAASTQSHSSWEPQSPPNCPRNPRSHSGLTTENIEVYRGPVANCPKQFATLKPYSSLSDPPWGPDKAGFPMKLLLRVEDTHAEDTPEQEKGLKPNTTGLSVLCHANFFSLIFCHISCFAPAIEPLVWLSSSNRKESFSSSTPSTTLIEYNRCSSGSFNYVDASTSRTFSDPFLPFIWKLSVWVRAWLWRKTCWLRIWLSLLFPLEWYSVSNHNFIHETTK